MNFDQIASLIRTLLKIVSSMMLAHGMTDTASLLNAPDVIGGLLLIASLVWSHYTHAEGDADSGAGGSKTLGLLIVTLAAAFCFSGCASAPENAYKAERTADITVTAAMTAWGDYVAKYSPPVSQELQVKAAFEKYQAAELLAIDATGTLAYGTSTNTAASDQYAAAAAVALADLITLIQSFGVKL